MLQQIKNKKDIVSFRRKSRVRYNLRNRNASSRLRLSVFVSNKHIYVQAIDDSSSLTVASASTLEKNNKDKCRGKSNTDAAQLIGKLIADRLLEKNITDVIFDRGDRLYQGKIKALADSARESGLNF